MVHSDMRQIGGPLRRRKKPFESKACTNVAFATTNRRSWPTSYKWKSKYGGLEILHAKQLKALEDENR